MPNLTSHERYEIYKYCLDSGVSEDIAVKIRENATNTLPKILSDRYRYTSTLIGEVLLGAFDWYYSPEGEDYWDNIFTDLESKGETE